MFLVQKANISFPFQPNTNKSSHILKPYLLATQLFDHNILLHLKTLDLTQPSSNVSLSWLSSAVTFLSTVHTEAENHISNLKANSKSKYEVDEYQTFYMDYSIKVLDLCNIISSGVNRLTERRRLMNFTLRLLNFTDEVPCKEKLNKALDIIERMKDVKNVNEKGLRAKAVMEELSLLINKLPRGNASGGRDLIRRTLYALGVLTVFVGSVLVNVLFGELDSVNVRVTDEFLWADSVNGVWNRIVDLVKIKEVDDVEKKAVVVGDLVKVVVEGGGGGGGDDGVRVCLEDGVKELALLIRKFSDGVDALTNGVNGLFGTVLKTRNSRLEI